MKKAFSIIDSLITLCIFSVILILAIPSFHNITEHYRTKSAVLSLQYAISLARSEAIKHSQSISICPTKNGKSCLQFWSNTGYLIFIDPTESGNITNQSQLIKYFKPIQSQGSWRWSGFRKRSYISFTSEGYTSYQNGTFTYCPSNSDNHFAKALFLLQTGRVRESIDQDKDGIDEDSSGNPLQC